VRTLFTGLLMVLALVAPMMGRAQEASPHVTVLGVEGEA
jgi:hypothetical protein